MSTPRPSQMLVISGAEALAGSILNFVNMNGRDIPIRHPTKTIKTMVSETTRATSTPPRQNPMTETATAMESPSSSATASSLPNILNQSRMWADRKSTRLNSSHVAISYAVFCLKEKNKQVVIYVNI